MNMQKKIFGEILFFLFVCSISLLFWMIMAVITDQEIIIREYLYARERNAFIATIGFIYFLRLNVWGKKPEAQF